MQGTCSVRDLPSECCQAGPAQLASVALSLFVLHVGFLYTDLTTGISGKHYFNFFLFLMQSF